MRSDKCPKSPNPLGGEQFPRGVTLGLVPNPGRCYSTGMRYTKSCGVFALFALSIGCGRLGYDSPSQSEWVFVDGDQATFDLGDYNSGSVPLVWSGEQIEFAGPPPFDTGQFGMYVSAVFDTGDDGSVWETLAWQPDAPYGKPLPDSGAGDSGYPAGSVSMADNILLLHLDSAALADGDRIIDSSGLGNHGQLVLDGQGATRTAGEFSGALDLDRDAWVTLDGNYFDFGTGDFTYSIWVKMRDCAESNDNRIAMGGAGTDDMPHMWIGALCPEECPDGDGAFMNFLDDTRAGPSLNVCSGVVLTDGAWHHLAGVKRGHTSPPALVQLFVDGREIDADSYDFGANTLTYIGGEIRLGSFNLNDPQYNTSIAVDEAAIWKRALGDAEVEALYRRGALDLELQVRVCADGACDSEPFIGPDGTSGTYFTEAELSGAAGTQSGNLASLGLVGAMAQYRARFSTTLATASPGLREVTLRARRPGL